MSGGEVEVFYLHNYLTIITLGYVALMRLLISLIFVIIDF